MNLLTLLVSAQYADSAYPAGGYTQSWGLETAVAEGHVATVNALERACRALLRHQAGPADAVAAAACCRRADGSVDGFIDAFSVIDRRLSATRPAAEARRASERMGRRLIDTAAVAEDDAWLVRLRQAVHNGATPGNNACVLGAVCGRLGLAPEAAAALSLWTAANGLLAAAMRLLPITHDDVQAALVRLRPLVAALAETAAVSEPDEIAAGAPQLDAWAMRHETAEVRLFSS